MPSSPPPPLKHVSNSFGFVRATEKMKNEEKVKKKSTIKILVVLNMLQGIVPANSQCGHRLKHETDAFVLNENNGQLSIMSTAYRTNMIISTALL